MGKLFIILLRTDYCLDFICTDSSDTICNIRNSVGNIDNSYVLGIVKAEQAVPSILLSFKIYLK